jgi:rubrerythrin
MPVCAKCGAFVGESEKECPSCGAPLTNAASPDLRFKDEVVNREYWTAALRKIPPMISDEERDTVKYEEFADLLELAGARYSAEIVRSQIAALEKHHAELLKSIQERMQRLL